MKGYYADLIGVKYKDNGRSKEEGFDCYGLVIECERRIGKNLQDVTYNSHDERLSDENASLLNVKKTARIKEGVILEFRKDGLLHIGFAINEKEFIHCTENQGVRISRIAGMTLFNKYEVIE